MELFFVFVFLFIDWAYDVENWLNFQYVAINDLQINELMAFLITFACSL